MLWEVFPVPVDLINALINPNNPLTDLNNRSVLVCYVYARLNRCVFNLDLN